MADDVNIYDWSLPNWDSHKPLTDQQDFQRRARARDLQEILRTPEGKRFFKDMMIVCGVFGEYFKGNSTDAFDRGCRAVGLRVWNLAGEADKKLQSELSPPYDEFPYQPREQTVPENANQVIE